MSQTLTWVKRFSISPVQNSSLDPHFTNFQNYFQSPSPKTLPSQPKYLGGYLWANTRRQVLYDHQNRRKHLSCWEKKLYPKCKSCHFSQSALNCSGPILYFATSAKSFHGFLFPKSCLEKSHHFQHSKVKLCPQKRHCFFFSFAFFFLKKKFPVFSALFYLNWDSTYI